MAIMDVKDPVYANEKLDNPDAVKYDSEGSSGLAEGEVENGKLERGLKGRHMQMIAIGMRSLRYGRTTEKRLLTRSGGSIGAGLFVGSGSAFHNGGPGSVVCTNEPWGGRNCVVDLFGS